jgi:predicted Zn-dependent protease with MMP-like domain
MDREKFQKMVSEALDAIPDEFQPYLANIEVVVEDAPSAELLRDLDLDPRHDTLFGLYHGTPLNERGHAHGGGLPDRIVLYYRPLVRGCRTPRALRREIRATVIHEIAHHFGLDDDAIEEEGY